MRHLCQQFPIHVTLKDKKIFFLKKRVVELKLIYSQNSHIWLNDNNIKSAK